MSAINKKMTPTEEKLAAALDSCDQAYEKSRKDFALLKEDRDRILQGFEELSNKYKAALTQIDLLKGLVEALKSENRVLVLRNRENPNPVKTPRKKGIRLKIHKTPVRVFDLGD